MGKLEMAVKARLPLVAVTSSDPVNLNPILVESLGEQVIVIPAPTKAGLPGLIKGAVYYWWSPGPTDWPAVYANMMQYKACLVVVNPVDVHPAMFNAGPLRVPETMVRKFVQKYASGEIDPIVHSLLGLSYKDILESAKLAMATHGEFTARSVREVRRSLYGEIGGLHQVDTEMLLYWPNKALTEWLALDGKLMRTDTPVVLRPRGLLLKGPPGTGKTMGAKYLAVELDLPLYLLEVGALLSKYHGESDKNLRDALAQAEANSPCILLIDEVEKLFESGDDTGITTRLMAALLWWLQEHKSAVLTVMTTNDMEAIPPELFRPGRIDQVIAFEGLPDVETTIKFALGLAAKLKNYGKVPSVQIKDRVLALINSLDRAVTPAEVSTAVLTLVKKEYLTNAKD